MLKIIFLIVCIEILAPGRAQNVVGKGLWSLISVSDCPDQGLARETIKCEINKHKFNRTHDGISAHIEIKEEVNEEYGLFIDVCKFVDGGCKQYQVISDNMGKLCDKYARVNVIRALEKTNFNGDYFPLPEGEYDLEDYMVDYCDLPSDCPFGKYEALVYLLSGQERVFCLKVIIECTKCEDDEYCCEDRDEE